MAVSTFMYAGALAREAWSNLLLVRQRSALALLGIVIGTASVVAMLSIGRMAGLEALKPFAAMGVDLLQVQKISRENVIEGLSVDQLQRLPHSVPGVVLATPYVLAQSHPMGAANAPPPMILAALPDLASVLGLQLTRGRFFTSAEQRTQVAVIGHALATPTTGELPVSLGDEVQAGGYLYRVIGVLAQAPQTVVTPGDINRSIIIPFDNASRSTGRPDPTGALVKISADADSAAISESLSRALGDPRAGDQVKVQDARQAVAAVKAQKAVQTRLLAALGSLSLLVGGIGVMNVMLMGIMERRREIGLRVALGATPRDIQGQFLAEALMLAVVGGVLGVALGVLAAAGAAAASHWTFSLALSAIPLGVGVSVTVGLAFGLYPAVKASRLDPIEALHAE